MGKTKAVAMLEAAIEKAGNKTALADDLGLSPQHINGWLRGGMPRYPTIVMLKSKLRIPLNAWVEEATDAA